MKTYDPKPEEKKKIEEIFTYHPIQGNQGEKYEQIRAQAMEFARKMQIFCPPSRELSLAITNLQQAVMFANAAIAIHEVDLV